MRSRSGSAIAGIRVWDKSGGRTARSAARVIHQSVTSSRLLWRFGPGRYRPGSVGGCHLAVKGRIVDCDIPLSVRGWHILRAHDGLAS